MLPGLPHLWPLLFNECNIWYLIYYISQSWVLSSMQHDISPFNLSHYKLLLLNSSPPPHRPPFLYSSIFTFILSASLLVYPSLFLHRCPSALEISGDFVQCSCLLAEIKGRLFDEFKNKLWDVTLFIHLHKTTTVNFIIEFLIFLGSHTCYCSILLCSNFIRICIIFCVIALQIYI